MSLASKGSATMAEIGANSETDNERFEKLKKRYNRINKPCITGLVGWLYVHPSRRT